MPPLNEVTTDGPIKTLYVGHSSSGKTGSLAALAASGYNLRILDFDNGCPILKDYLMNPESIYYKRDPEAWKRVHVVTLTDPKKNIAGKLQTSKATAWADGLKMMTHWKDGDIDLGSLDKWTTKDILVLDSLTSMADVAYNNHLAMNGRLLTGYSEDAYGKDVGAVQRVLKDVMALLNDKSVACNVILISHLTVSDEIGRALKPKEDGHAYPSSIGKALGPQIPRWFNNMLYVKEVGTNRKIFTDFQTTDGNVVSTKTSAPLRVKKSYGIEWGLSEYFADLRGSKAP